MYWAPLGGSHWCIMSHLQSTCAWIATLPFGLLLLLSRMLLSKVGCFHLSVVYLVGCKIFLYRWLTPILFKVLHFVSSDLSHLSGALCFKFLVSSLALGLVTNFVKHLFIIIVYQESHTFLSTIHGYAFATFLNTSKLFLACT